MKHVCILVLLILFCVADGRAERRVLLQVGQFLVFGDSCASGATLEVVKEYDVVFSECFEDMMRVREVQIFRGGKESFSDLVFTVETCDYLVLYLLKWEDSTQKFSLTEIAEISNVALYADPEILPAEPVLDFQISQEGKLLTNATADGEQVHGFSQVINLLQYYE